jgi:uncharacterized protein (DUF849 family)
MQGNTKEQSKEDLIVNFAPTGLIPTKDLNPNVPISPEEIIEQVHEAYEIGITLVHIHARYTESGKPTYKKSVYAKILSGIKKYCPDLVIGVSTSGRVFKKFTERSEVLELKPDMASLTLSSLNFINSPHINEPEMVKKLAIKMATLGIHPELEVFDSGMINYGKYLIKKEILKPPFYWNLLFGNIFTAQSDLATIGLTIKELPPKSLYALAGLGSYQLNVTMIAVASGAGVRIGLEDNIFFNSEKKIPASNIELIKRVHRIGKICERKIMKPKDFGLKGFYNSTK